MYSKVNQLYIYIYPFFLKFFSHMGYYKILNNVVVYYTPTKLKKNEFEDDCWCFYKKKNMIILEIGFMKKIAVRY